MVLLLHRNPWDLFFCLILLSLAWFLSKLPINIIKRDFRLALWLLTAALVVHLNSFWQAFQADSWIKGRVMIWQGLDPVATLFLMILAATLLGRTNSPIELSFALGKLLSPLKKVGIPIPDFNLMLLTTFHFIPILCLEAQKVYRAQLMRGFWQEDKTILHSFKSLPAFLVPILVHSLHCSQDLADNWLLRGYRAGQKRSSLITCRLTWRELLAFGAVAILYIVSFLL